MDERVRAAIAVVAEAAAARAEARLGEENPKLRPSFERFLVGVVSCGFVAGVYLQPVDGRAEGGAVMVGPQSWEAYAIVAKHLEDLHAGLLRKLFADEEVQEVLEVLAIVEANQGGSTN